MKRDELTQEYLKSILDYDPETGIFRRKTTDGGVNIDDIAGYMTESKYRRISIKNSGHYAHRLAWLYMTGNWPKNQIDHINGIRHDNRLTNLRECTVGENAQNQTRPRSSNRTSKYLGVYFQKDSRNTKSGWKSSIRVNGEYFYLGRFADEESAHEAYLAAKRIHHSFSTI